MAKLLGCLTENQANLSTFKIVPENLIVKTIFSLIDSFSWKDYTITFKFTGRKVLLGKGFEAHGFSVSTSKPQKKPVDYKSQNEISIAKKESFFESLSKRAKMGGAKGGRTRRRSKNKGVSL